VAWDARDATSAITTGWSLLLAAALADDLAAVRQLIGLGSTNLINLALRDRWPDLCCFPAGLTPLMAAMAFSQFEIVTSLLSAQADPNAIDGDGRGLDAFTMACVFGRAENVKQWLHVFPGWDLERKDGTIGGSALHAAAGFPPRSAPTISVLLAAGADANSATDAGPDALMLLAAKDDSDTEAVQLLLDAGIDVNRQSHPLTLKWTFLLTMTRAAWHFGRRSPLVDVLARSEGATALHRAWTAKHVRIAEMLEKAGADDTLCNHLGQRPKDAIA
jgi:ankyrin repeat protein